MSVLQGPEFYISKRMGRAIIDYQMLAAGDKIVVAVSGGKDSLTMLRILHHRRAFVPIHYELVAVHIDSGYPVSCAKPLARYFRSLGVPSHIEKISLTAEGKNQRKDINCFWCSWNRRKALFEVAHRLGATKVALGHHKDDIAETILLNLFFHGEISAMVPRQELFDGKIVLIRPLAYVEERLIKRFVKEADFPLYDCACPNAAVSNRTLMSTIIRRLERVCPELKTNIIRSLQRIKKDYLL